MEKEHANAEAAPVEANGDVKPENGAEESSDLSQSLPDDEEDGKGNDL